VKRWREQRKDNGRMAKLSTRHGASGRATGPGPNTQGGHMSASADLDSPIANGLAYTSYHSFRFGAI
jgi:hypothetical protein